MKKSIVSTVLVSSLVVMAGCSVGGTTYGTGTTHEQATLQGLGNIFSLKNEQQAIEYKSRPELVMPANKNVLPQPVDTQALTTDGNWPVSPDERIAAVRGAAPKPDEYGNLPVEYLNDTNKPGIESTQQLDAGLQRETRRSNVNAGGGEFIQAIRNDANGVGEGRLARERREQISYSSGPKRKFLTEPPVEYRTPAATADAGQFGVESEELRRRQEEARKDRRNLRNTTLEPTAAEF